MPVTIKPIPCFSDNYCWYIQNESVSICVDPAEASVVLGFLSSNTSSSSSSSSSSSLSGVLTTHHHKDHSGGNEEIAAAYPGIPILGGTAEDGKIPAATHLVKDNEVVTVGGLRFTCFHTPCHTKGHICYFLAPEDSGLPHGCIFTGDTLFAAGCGRFFEGDAYQMLENMNRFAALPTNTHIFVGHEYTISNLQFCLHVEPTNEKTLARLELCKKLRAEGKPTLPCTIQDELDTNVFMRTNIESVKVWAGGAELGGADVMKRLREAKNEFKVPDLV